jgi:tetratricopeptide (TPR) repeat protein
MVLLYHLGEADLQQNTCSETDRKFDLAFAQGVELAQQAAFAEAAQVFAEAARIKPTETDATVKHAVMLYNLGSTMQDIEAVVKAEKLLAQTIALGGMHASPGAYFYSGVIQEATGRIGQAITNWEHAVTAAIAAGVDKTDANTANARAKLQAAFPAQCSLPAPIDKPQSITSTDISASCADKTALLFMVKDEVHFDALWRAWLQTNDGHCFKPIVHFSEPVAGKQRLPVFAHERVPTVPSSWCKIVPVQMELLRAALEDEVCGVWRYSI